jgi:hypothetical protein
MGRFIILQDLTNDNTWIVPKELLKWDYRYQPEPWPNDLFPFYLDWYWGKEWWSWETKVAKIMLRRWVEQKCAGDVAIVRLSADNNNDRLWFEHEGDMVLTKLTWGDYLTP